MRTTLSLDPDVARELERRQRRERRSMKQIVNEALRAGLAQLDAPSRSGKAFRTQPLDVGRCRFPNVDSIADTLALAEGDDFR
jgi:hypothetical protein